MAKTLPLVSNGPGKRGHKTQELDIEKLAHEISWLIFIKILLLAFQHQDIGHIDLLSPILTWGYFSLLRIVDRNHGLTMIMNVCRLHRGGNFFYT